MTTKELLRILIAMPDETVILLDAGEGTFLEGGLAGVGICDPDNTDVDGLYTELWDFKDGKDSPRNTPDNCFPVLALSPALTKSDTTVVIAGGGTVKQCRSKRVYQLGYEI